MTNIRHLSDLAPVVDNIPDATPDEHTAAAAYLQATGNTDLSHYIFGGDTA